MGGGGIYIQGSEVSFSRVDISKCVASTGGGGVRVTDASSVTFTDSSIVGCGATEGGGLDVGDGSTVVFVFGEISRNIVGHQGGGVYIRDAISSAHFYGSFFADNSAVSRRGEDAFLASPEGSSVFSTDARDCPAGTHGDEYGVSSELRALDVNSDSFQDDDSYSRSISTFKYASYRCWRCHSEEYAPPLSKSCSYVSSNCPLGAYSGSGVPCSAAPTLSPTLAAKFTAASSALFSEGFESSDDWTAAHETAYKVALASSVNLLKSPDDVDITNTQMIETSESSSSRRNLYAPEQASATVRRVIEKAAVEYIAEEHDTNSNREKRLLRGRMITIPTNYSNQSAPASTALEVLYELTITTAPGVSNVPSLAASLSTQLAGAFSGGNFTGAFVEAAENAGIPNASSFVLNPNLTLALLEAGGLSIDFLYDPSSLPSPRPSPWPSPSPSISPTPPPSASPTPVPSVVPTNRLNRPGSNGGGTFGEASLGIILGCGILVFMCIIGLCWRMGLLKQDRGLSREGNGSSSGRGASKKNLVKQRTLKKRPSYTSREAPVRGSKALEDLIEMSNVVQGTGDDGESSFSLDIPVPGAASDVKLSRLPAQKVRQDSANFGAMHRAMVGDVDFDLDGVDDGEKQSNDNIQKGALKRDLEIARVPAEPVRQHSVNFDAMHQALADDLDFDLDEERKDQSSSSASASGSSTMPISPTSKDAKRAAPARASVALEDLIIDSEGDFDDGHSEGVDQVSDSMQHESKRRDAPVRASLALEDIVGGSDNEEREDAADVSLLAEMAAGNDEKDDDGDATIDGSDSDSNDSSESSSDEISHDESTQSTSDKEEEDEDDLRILLGKVGLDVDEYYDALYEAAGGNTAKDIKELGISEIIKSARVPRMKARLMHSLATTVTAKYGAATPSERELTALTSRESSTRGRGRGGKGVRRGAPRGRGRGGAK